MLLLVDDDIVPFVDVVDGVVVVVVVVVKEERDEGDDTSTDGFVFVVVVVDAGGDGMQRVCFFIPIETSIMGSAQARIRENNPVKIQLTNTHRISMNRPRNIVLSNIGIIAHLGM